MQAKEQRYVLTAHIVYLIKLISSLDLCSTVPYKATTELRTNEAHATVAGVPMQRNEAYSPIVLVPMQRNEAYESVLKPANTLDAHTIPEYEIIQ